MPPRAFRPLSRPIGRRCASTAPGTQPLDIATRLELALSRGPRAPTPVPAVPFRAVSRRKHVILPRSERKWPEWTRDGGVSRDWAAVWAHPGQPAKAETDDWRWDFAWAAERPLPKVPSGLERRRGARNLVKKLRAELGLEKPARNVQGPFKEAEKIIQGIESLEDMETLDSAVDSLVALAESMKNPSDALAAMISNLLRHLLRSENLESAEHVFFNYLELCGISIDSSTSTTTQFSYSYKPTSILFYSYLAAGDLDTLVALYPRLPYSSALASTVFARLASIDPQKAISLYQFNPLSEPPLTVCNAMLSAALETSHPSAVEHFRTLRRLHDPNAETTMILVRNAADPEEIRSVVLDSLRYHGQHTSVLIAAVDSLSRFGAGEVKAFENWAGHALKKPLPESVVARIRKRLIQSGTAVPVPPRAEKGLVTALLRSTQRPEHIRRLYAQLSSEEIPEGLLKAIVEGMGRTGDLEGVRELYKKHKTRASPELLGVFAAAMKSEPELAVSLLKGSGGAKAAVEVLDGIEKESWHVLPHLLANLVSNGVDGIPRDRVSTALRRVVSRASSTSPEQDPEMELLRDAVARAAARAVEEDSRRIREGEDVDDALDRLEAFLEGLDGDEK